MVDKVIYSPNDILESVAVDILTSWNGNSRLLDGDDLLCTSFGTEHRKNPSPATYVQDSLAFEELRVGFNEAFICVGADIVF